MPASALLASSLKWKDVIKRAGESHSPVMLDASAHALTVSGVLKGKGRRSNNAISGLAITGQHPVTLAGSGRVTVTDTVTAESDIIIDGITIDARSIVSGGTIIIRGGGTLVAQSVAANIMFDATPSPANNTLQINCSSAPLSNVTNLAPGDVIDFLGNVWDTSVSWIENSNGTYSLIGSTGDMLISSVSFAKKADGTPYTPEEFSFMRTVSYKGGKSRALTRVGFLAGSLIETTTGDVPVETIKEGDQVIAYVEGMPFTRPVVWRGHKHVAVHAGLPDDEAGYPVRILKDAIADGVPHKDMLIAADHSLFFDGSFIPVRLLVNGRTIFFDHTVSSYDAYHIETSHHSIIQADGVLTESYLKTGHQHESLKNKKTITPPAAAPRMVARTRVEALFLTLQSRAQALGVSSKVSDVALTHDADLRLAISKRQTIRAMRVVNGNHLFMIPPGVGTVRIFSRTTRPCDLHGPFVDDRRPLGVLVGNISLRGMRKKIEITTHLTTEEADGWSVPENLPCRWTMGNALLPLDLRHECRVLSLQVLSSGPYRSVPEQVSVLSVS